MALLRFQFTVSGILDVFSWKFAHFGLVFRLCLPAFLYDLLVNYSFCWMNACWAYLFLVKLPIFGLVFKVSCVFLHNNLASLGQTQNQPGVQRLKQNCSCFHTKRTVVWCGLCADAGLQKNYHVFLVDLSLRKGDFAQCFNQWHFRDLCVRSTRF